MTNTRLDTLDPQLAQKLRAANNPARRKAAAAAAAAAISMLKLHDPRIREAEAVLTTGGNAVAERDALRALRDRLDDGYWDLEEAAGASRDSDALFSSARAVAALYFALDPDPLTAATEAVYEAATAIGDDPIVAAVRRALAGEAGDGER